ncbi:MAG: MFS transporter [Alphaproteobacteria bacterium]|nr:MFS transporter [Alphaproteobacteria bacterium]
MSASGQPNSFFDAPALIRRNIVLFALSQSFTGAGMQMAYGIGPLMIVVVSGSASLAGMSVALIAISRFLIAYPLGKITDTYGRKPGIMMGLVLALMGVLIIAAAMNYRSFAALSAGLLVFSMGMSAAQQMRVAATDMFPPRMRAQALGYVALGSLAGLLVTPTLIASSETIAPALRLDVLTVPWLILPVLILGGMVMIFFVRPDPMQIGMNLSTYYPGYTPVKRSQRGEASGKIFDPWDLLRNPQTRLAIAANCSGQANMSIVMVMTSLVLHHQGHSLTQIGFSHMFHSLGMFAFTIPLGRMADRIGRNPVMYGGVMVALAGASFVAFGHGIFAVTLGTFLVGIGWAAGNVAATALVADFARTEHRGRAIGLNESFAGGASLFAAVVTGPMIQWSGLWTAGVVAIVMAAIPLVMYVFTPSARGAQ